MDFDRDSMQLCSYTETFGMPIEFGIWRIDASNQTTRIEPTLLNFESRLQQALEDNISILGENLDLMIIGGKVATSYGSEMDILAMDVLGNLYVIELKRGRTPRDVVGQVLDYASWVSRLSFEDIEEKFARFQRRKFPDKPAKSFEEAFKERFEVNALPEVINLNHRLIVVASALDPSSERIVDYLSRQYGVPINAVFFNYFQDGNREYLARTWLNDPYVIQQEIEQQASKRTRPAWNERDFYYIMDECEYRSWADLSHYGFISAGGGRKYSGMLENLFPGARVFAYVKGKGYVGVGHVTGEARLAKEHRIMDKDGQTVSLLDMPMQASKFPENLDDPELGEYLVPIEWQKTVPIQEALTFPGRFANQNIVCRLTHKPTLAKLAEFFDLADIADLTLA